MNTVIGIVFLYVDMDQLSVSWCELD